MWRLPDVSCRSIARISRKLRKMLSRACTACMHILRFSRDLPGPAGQFSVVREARVETRLREKLGVRPREYRNCVLFNGKLLRWSRKIALSKDQTICDDKIGILCIK